MDLRLGEGEILPSPRATAVEGMAPRTVPKHAQDATSTTGTANKGGKEQLPTFPGLHVRSRVLPCASHV